MKMKITGGRVLHPMLSFAFSMLELGGSNIQKYNTLLGTYVPDRTLTPYQVKPKLVVSDPEGNIPTGDYASSMKNVVWTLRLLDGKSVIPLTKGTSPTTGDYYVDTVHALTIRKNVSQTQMISVDFYGEYYNPVRNETSRFNWHKTLNTADETETNINLELRFPSKMNFSAFKNYGKFPIEAVLLNGGVPLDNNHAVYKWQTFEAGTKTWRDIDESSDLWYAGGKDGSQLTVDVDFIQHTVLRVMGWAKSDPSQIYSASTLLRRWYGQWEDTYEFAYAKFLYTTTRQTKAVVKVTNRQGDIRDPQQYFDIQLFYREDATSAWKSLGNGTEFVVQREQLTGEHQLGGVCRELSAYQPIALPDGTVLADSDGKPIVARFPTSEIETD